VAIIGLLAAIAIPSFMKARTTSQKNSCINNLRQIESAKDQWVIEHGGTNGALIEATQSATTFTNLVGPNSYIKANPSCPAGSDANAKGTAARAQADYTIAAIGTNPLCNIQGVGVGAADHVLP